MTNAVSSTAVKVKPNVPGQEKKSVKSPRRASIFFPTKEETKEQLLKTQQKNGNLNKLIELQAKQFSQKVSDKMKDKKNHDVEYLKLTKELEKIDDQINRIKTQYDPLCIEIENKKIKYNEIKLVNQNLNKEHLEIVNSVKDTFDKESHKMSLIAKEEALQVQGGPKKSVLACVKGIEDKKLSTPKSVMFSPINNVRSPREVNKSKSLIQNLSIPIPGTKDYNCYQNRNNNNSKTQTVSFNTPRIKTSKFGSTT
jgi:hypothetical protein